MNWALAALVVAITLTVFSVTYSAEFVRWDDDVNIYNNPHLRGGVNVHSLIWMFTDMNYIPRYMPLGWLSYAVNYQFGGLNPVGYHAGNMVFHALNALLVYFLLQRLLRLISSAAGREMNWRGVLAGSAIGALLWAIHPLRAEPVACASGRIYSQALFFLLISSWSYLRAQETPAGARAKWLWGSAGMFLASLLTYPIALGFVIVFVLADFYPLRRLTLSRSLFTRTTLPVWREKIPFVVAGAFVVVLTLWARVHSGQYAAPVTLDEFGVSSRVMQGFYVWAYYLWKTLLPLDLSPTYTALLSFHPWSAPFLASAGLVVGVSLLVFAKARRWPASAVLWIGYLALLVPMLGLTEHPHYTYDRYNYIVAILFSVPIAWWLAVAWAKRTRVALCGVWCVVLIALGIATFQQAARWQNTPTLLGYIIEKVGAHPIAA
ncbi:MAG TPA: hypothetical protein VNT99_09685, partial [Methylomirabilota bacterium]|nr:hypothetical protein [Methylomirabilota bacterium]